MTEEVKSEGEEGNKGWECGGNNGRGREKAGERGEKRQIRGAANNDER